MPHPIAALLLLLSLLATWPAESAAARKTADQESVRLFADPESAELLDHMALPLLEAADMPGEQVRFHIMLENTLNAFALPNNHIVFHSRLVLAVQDRDELASVMAHEIAHLAAGHHSQMQDSARNISIRSLVAAAIGLAAGLATKNPELSQASMMGGMASGTASILEMVREKEAQADRLAVRYLARGGYQTRGLVDFMERVSREQRLSPIPPPYLLTHPLGSQRVDEARDMTSRIVAESPRADQGDSANLLRVQAKLQAATAQDPFEAANQFREILKKKPADFAARYGLAMACRYSGNLAESDALLTTLLKESGGQDPFILRERALGHLEKGDLKTARKDIEAALRQKPDNPDFRYRHAFILKEAGELENASRVLRRLTQEHENYPDALYLFGTVEGELGRRGSSHLALARYNRLDRERDAALWHYRNAIQAISPDSVEHAQAEGELESLLEEEKRPYIQLQRPRRR